MQGIKMPLGPVMLDLVGTVLQDDEKVMLSNPLVGGVIYFARNYQSPAQIKSLSDAIRDIRPELLIAVDQEGGRVQRFIEGFTRLPAMQKFLPLYRKNAEACLGMVKNCGWLMASELLAVGVDFSFAPVLDVDDIGCDVIANRSFSPNPQEVCALASAWMSGMHEAGMATTGKHFPGHGSVTSDSHLTQPVDTREFVDIARHDLIPFVELFASLDAVMPAHILFSSVDAMHTVGFSSYWLQTILRKDLGFEGVIFSDDLSMRGAASVGGYVARAEHALAAGCDMVLICNNRDGANEVLKSLNFTATSIEDKEVRQRWSNRLSGMSANHCVGALSVKDKYLSLDELQQVARWQLSQQIINVLT
jgi:beta-N-acetylhexosaminidase